MGEVSCTIWTICVHALCDHHRWIFDWYHCLGNQNAISAKSNPFCLENHFIGDRSHPMKYYCVPFLILTIAHFLSKYAPDFLYGLFVFPTSQVMPFELTLVRVSPRGLSPYKYCISTSHLGWYHTWCYAVNVLTYGCLWLCWSPDSESLPLPLKSSYWLLQRKIPLEHNKGKSAVHQSRRDSKQRQ